MTTTAPSPSSAPASPAPRRPRPPATPASTAASSSSATKPARPTSDRRCPRPCSAASKDTDTDPRPRRRASTPSTTIELVTDRGRGARPDGPHASSSPAARPLAFDTRRPRHRRGAPPPRRSRRRPRRRPLPPHDRRRRPTAATPSAPRAASRSIGAGWIGSEVAASARQMGADVVLIDPAPGAAAPGARRRDRRRVPPSSTPTTASTLRLGTGVAELRGTKTVEEVVLDDGRVEAADVVVVGIGVTPRTELADAAGLRVDNGIVVDEHLADQRARASTPPATSPTPGTRTTAGTSASSTGPTPSTRGSPPGATPPGRRDAYTRLPYFFSDQYDLGMEYVGYGDADDDVDRPRRPGRPRVHRLLASRRHRHRRDERQHLGRRRRPQGHHRSPPRDRPGPARRSSGAAR